MRNCHLKISKKIVGMRNIIFIFIVITIPSWGQLPIELSNIIMKEEKHMGTIELNRDNFKGTVEENELVFVDFWASWCGPCKQFSPVYEDVSADHNDIVFGKVDVDANPEIASSFSITSIPTIAVIKSGVVLHQQPGALTKQSLVKLVSAAKGASAVAQ